MHNHRSRMLVFIGTYTRPEPHVQGKAEGIYMYELDAASGALRYLSTTTGQINPSFVALDARGHYLYAVNEVAEYNNQPGGSVSAFRVDPDRGRLTLINSQPTHGAAPCYVSLDASGAWVLVANYSSGNASILPIVADGGLAPATATVQHRGASQHPERQREPHAHAIIADPTNRFGLVADLGVDKIFVYRLDTAQGQLAPHAPPWVALHPGAGPRQLAFHPNGHSLYCINELDATLTVFEYAEASGTLRTIQTLPTVPDGSAVDLSGADVHVAPSGRFVYTATRGDNSLAMFAIDPASGHLTNIGSMPVGGRTPRNFCIDPSGNFVLVANQDSDTITTFRIDQAHGTLEPTEHVTRVPSPACIQMIAYSGEAQKQRANEPAYPGQ